MLETLLMIFVCLLALSAAAISGVIHAIRR